MQAILNFPTTLEIPHWSLFGAMGVLFLMPMEKEPLPTLSFEQQEVLQILQKKLPLEFQPQSEQITKTLFDAAEEHKIAPSLILALMETESSFQPLARSKAGAIGLMQLLPTTAEQVAKENNIPYEKEVDLLDPQINVRLGIAYLAHLKSRFSEKNHYLAAYNLGPTALKKRHFRGDFSLGIMKKYVGKIRTKERFYSGTSVALR
jgi:soluble lytic murein transglycosylase-like protein